MHPNLILFLVKIKSLILDLGLDIVTKNLLAMQYPFQWSESGIEYLGITLTKNPNNLF